MSLSLGIAVDIVSADYLGDHRLRLTFSDGHVTTVDFGSFLRTALHPDIAKYCDESLFCAFTLAYGNLVWGDHELCFPIEDLYAGKLDHRNDANGVLAVAETHMACAEEEK
jgi:hypothetical protein